jgi:hypothetical protein
MAHRNKFDKTGNSFEIGKRAEDVFMVLAQRREYIIRESTDAEDKFDHIEYVMTKNNQKISVDVKARKKISRRDLDQNDFLVWVEWKNVIGKKGWLYGKADLIAFEQEHDYLIVSRNQLALLCERLVDQKTIAESPHSALNKIYQREGRKDKLSLIRISDIENNIKSLRWKK